MAQDSDASDLTFGDEAARFTIRATVVLAALFLAVVLLFVR